jgi:serine/threonine-protein kinase
VIGSVIGNYVVKAKVGEGGMGVVYLAEHPRLGRKVAIKLLHAQFSQTPEFVSRFFVEAKAATEIGSDHIVGVLDFGELPDGQSYLILEWLEGHSLAQVLTDEKKLSLVRAIHIARGVARALAAAHAIGIVHRDLKPDNVFLVRKEDDPEFAKVLDFGIAKLLHEGKNDAVRVKTETGAIFGTPAYMSPEQCRGAEKVDPRSDIYSLGVIFFEMVTGRVPFEAQGLGDLLIAHMTEEPPPLRAIDQTIPEPIEAAIAKSLHKSPDLRFQSMDAFMTALSDAWAASGPIRTGVMPTAAGVHEVRSAQSTLSRTAAELVSPERGSRPRPTLAIAGVAMAAALGVGVVAWRMNHRAEELKPAVSEPKLVTPAPKVQTPVAPATVKLEIRVAPATAQLTLDGKLLANPYAAELPLDHDIHQIVAQAQGYKKDARTLVLDRDHSLDVALEREAAPPKAKPHTPALAQPTKPPVTPPHAQPKPSPKPNDDGKPIYKGTKGTLITDFPEK